MNEEMKESIRILEEYTTDKEETFTVLNKNTKALRILLDYITNLQEEYEYYKSRNEKAIEYIKKYQRKDGFLNLNEWQTIDLLNILGGDKE